MLSAWMRAGRVAGRRWLPGSPWLEGADGQEGQLLAGRGSASGATGVIGRRRGTAITATMQSTAAAAMAIAWHRLVSLPRFPIAV